jgi:hypothetical protein
VTGHFDELMFDAPRRLVRAWLLLSVASLGMSVLCAAVLVLARTPMLGGWLPAHLFGRALVLHVDLATLVWFLSFAGALWSTSVSARGVSSVWVAWSISLLGASAMLVASFVVPGQAVLSNYVPMVDHPLFVGGLVWFGAGIVVAAIAGLRKLAGGDSDALQWAKLPLLMALLALAHAAIDPAGHASAAVLESAVWGAGHLLQFVYVVLAMFGWSALVGVSGVAAPSPTIRRMLFALAALPVLATPFLMWSSWGRQHDLWLGYSQLMRWTSWPAACAFGVFLAIGLWRSRSGAFSLERLALAGSVLLFALGCIAGAAIRTETTMVPAHYHGTIGAVTAVFMGLAYRMMPLLGAEAVDARRARLQLTTYIAGLLVLMAGLAWSGVMGAPRKSPFSGDGASLASTVAAVLIGIGGAAAVTSVIAFVWMFLRGMRGNVARANLQTVGRNDVRWKALAATAAGIVVLGAALTWWPAGFGRDQGSGRDPLAGRGEHARQQREAEVKSRFEQGVVMLHARQFDPAIASFHRVLELAPEMPEAHVNMGFALLGLSRFDAARDFFESATDLRPDQINAYYGLALALEGLGDFPGATGAMRTYLHRSQKDDPFRTKAQAALDGWQTRLAKR